MYSLLVIGCYYLLKDMYLEENHKRVANWQEKLALLLASFGVFFTVFVFMAIYTIKYSTHD